MILYHPPGTVHSLHKYDISDKNYLYLKGILSNLWQPTKGGATNLCEICHG